MSVHAMTGLLVLYTETRSRMRALFCPLRQSHISWRLITHANESTSLYSMSERWLVRECSVKSTTTLVNCWLCLSVSAMAQRPTAKPSRTLDWLVRRTTCMCASCALEPSWTIRYRMHRPDGYKNLRDIWLDCS